MFISIAPLYPDTEDVPKNRVLIKVGSGPGRANIPALARLRALGFYMVPGAPNYLTQATGQNYGPFQTHYWNNPEKLSQYRFDKEATLNMQDFRFWFLNAWMAKKEIG